MGYVTREWNYGGYADGRWGRWKVGPMRRGRRAINDWDLGNERLLCGGYPLIPIEESEARAFLDEDGE